MGNNWFHFKQFSIFQKGAGMKVGTDGVLLGSWAGKGKCEKILDIGTGTGLIRFQHPSLNKMLIILHGQQELNYTWIHFQTMPKVVLKNMI